MCMLGAGCGAVCEDGGGVGGGGSHPGGKHVLPSYQRQGHCASLCDSVRHPTCQKRSHPTHQVGISITK